MGAATTSAPEPDHVRGRPDLGAAAARTEELYAHHGRLVLGLCRALLRDAAEGEDAAQQTFLSAHRSLVNGAVPEEPAAWLATIARNECWARIRSGMRRPLPTADVEGELSTSDPLAEAIRRADLAAMWAAIAELPRPQRDALLLREFGGLSYEELAGALAVTGAAVESLLFRARQGVRVRLEAAYAGLTGGTWLDALARFGGIGGGLAPVAAKVAAVGVGAAVATGGAVVAPRLLEQGQQHPAPAKHASTQPVAPRQVAASPAPVRPVRAASRHTVALVGPASVGDHRSSGEDRASGSDGGSRGGEAADSGDERAATAALTRDHETDGAARTRTDAKARDVTSSNDGGEADTRESSHGGDAAPAPNPTVTFTVATGEPPPLEGETAPGSDH